MNGWPWAQHYPIARSCNRGGAGQSTIDLGLTLSQSGAMTSPASLLVIWHSRTGASKQMARAAAAHPAARLMQAVEVTADDLVGAQGYLFVCPENLAALGGAMKEMFDAQYYAVLGRIEGRPYASIIAAGSDGTGAQRQLERIAAGWRLRRVADPMIVNFAAQTPEAILAPKVPDPGTLRNCRELGFGLAEGIVLGVF